MQARHSFSTETSASTKRNDLSDVHSAELGSAVRRGDGAAVTRWGTICAASGAIDCRCAAHSKGGIFSLCAPPLWLAVYRGDGAIAEVLLKAGASPDGAARSCPGGGHSTCEIGGQSALHLAVGRGALDCVQRLVSLRAAPDAPVCFGLEEEADEPEWNEATESFEGGLAGLTVLQLAALRSSDTTMCELLLSHGADSTSISELPPTMQLRCEGLAPKLRMLCGDDGQPLDCPICLAPIVGLTAEWTVCCVRGFHAHCLQGLDTCPMCRTRRGEGGRSLAPPGDAAAAQALQATMAYRDDETSQALQEMLRRGDDARGADAGARRTRLEYRLELADQAMDMAFSGPQWSAGGGGGTDAYADVAMGSRYGHRCLPRGPW